jgi:DNA processing protein
MSELLYWLWLSELKNVGSVTAMKYIDYFGSVKRVFEAGFDEIIRVPGSRRSEAEQLNNKELSRAKNILKNCRKTGTGIITLYDSLYPKRLANIYDPPLVLYYRGTLPDMDYEAVIGVVGTRKASVYGLKTAQRIASEIACGGGIVSTGLAEGIDSAAAKGALKEAGFVIGVLGTGTDITYPSWNRKLQSRIASEGLLLSEYPPGQKATRGSFPARNRIISGISLGVAVIEAPAKSGSLITAARAIEQGRDVFAVPGNIDLRGFEGSNALIRDGASLITSGWDILSQYEWRFPDKISAAPVKSKTVSIDLKENDRKDASVRGKIEVDNNSSMEYIDLEEQVGNLTDDEIKILRVMSSKVMHIDEIIINSALQADRALAALTQLELKGFATDAGGKHFQLNVKTK